MQLGCSHLNGRTGAAERVFIVSLVFSVEVGETCFLEEAADDSFYF